jgi:hypothetical protein
MLRLLPTSLWRRISRYSLGSPLVALVVLIKKSPLILSIVVPLFSVCAHARSEVCNADLTARVGKHFKLNGLYASSEKVVAEHCKPWPTDTEKTIALFVYDDLPKKKLLLALVNSKTNTILSSYSGWMPEEDAVTRVGEGSARLDNAPYVLSKSARAFGVVFDTTWLPCAVSDGTSQELQLFVSEGKRIRPIFKNSTPIYYWRRETTDCFNPGKAFSMPVTVSVLQTASSGFFDLRLTAVEREDVDDPKSESAAKRSLSHTIKYDGRSYDLLPWKKRFSCWNEKIDCSFPSQETPSK